MLAERDDGESAAGAGRTLREGDYERLRAELEKAMRRLCPPWLQDRREDLVQAALLRMLEIERKAAAAGEKNRELPASYLWRVANSALIDEIRRQRRRHEVEIDEHAEATLESKAPSADRQLAAGESARALRDCLRSLVESRRLAVTLHLQGYGVPEASALLAWDVKKVYNLVHRGLNDLRACLAGKGIEP